MVKRKFDQTSDSLKVLCRINSNIILHLQGNIDIVSSTKFESVTSLCIMSLSHYGHTVQR